jgi:hypothetical protein
MRDNWTKIAQYLIKYKQKWERAVKRSSVLKGSDDGVLYLIKPRFWTFSIVTGYKKHNISGAGSAPVIR